MTVRPEQVRLQDGTLVRHKFTGYEGRIEGTTEIKTCFTTAGHLLDKSHSKQTFQYRVVVQGESMRRIAPVEDLEILEEAAKVTCAGCHAFFWSRPGLAGKPTGRCPCGGWICPSCLSCQNNGQETGQGGQSSCPQQRKRVVRKLALRKKGRGGLNA